MELTAIKVKIGLNVNGSAKYPSFNNLPVVKAAGMDWAKYVDTQGLGWHYDKTSGHQDETADSPRGQQYGVLIIPEQFAVEAEAAFPSECTRINEIELQDFYETKAHAHEPDDNIDEQVINSLQATLNLMEKTGAKPAELTAMKAKIKNAMNPNHQEPGIKRNKRKKWVDMKLNTNVTIKNPV